MVRKYCSRSQNFESDVLAYTPPLLPLKPVPNELLSGDLIPHPWFPDWAAAQFVPPTTDPEMARAEELEEEMVHPGFVCIVALEESYSERCWVICRYMELTDYSCNY